MNLSPRDRGIAAALCVVLLWKMVAMSPSVVDDDVFGKLGSLCWSPRVPRDGQKELWPHCPHRLCFGPLMRSVDPVLAPFSLSERMFPPSG